MLRLDPELHKRAKKSAANTGISLNEFCVKAIEASVTGLGQESALIGRLKTMFGSSLLGVLLFGSVSRGTQRENSDIDLLLVLDEDVPLVRSLYTRWDKEELDPRLSPHFVHRPLTVDDAGSIWLETAIDGIVLFEADRSLSVLLRDLRHAVLSGDLQRKIAYGHAYWVRKKPEESHVQ